jgi:cytoskeletal protein CcmA (bactofilin family)
VPNVIIGNGCRINGKLDLEGESQIHGHVEGEVRSRDELVIGEKAVVDAMLFGAVIKIFGRVNGDITCTERLELHAGACVTGNLFSPSLVIREGVVFEGKCSMRSQQGADLRSEHKVGSVLELKSSQMQSSPAISAATSAGAELREGNA